MSKASDNIDGLVDLVETVLRSRGKAKSTDTEGNTIYIDMNIYDREVLISFITLSLSNFNQTPHFTFFTFKDTEAIELFTEVLVEGAVLYALGSQALIERGREFQITDGGITFYPPTVSELLNTQYSTLLQFHSEKLKLIKEKISHLDLPGKK